MELDDLKQGWQRAGTGQRTAAELLKMTKLRNHPTIKKIRTKLIIETALLLLLLAVYYTGFDGDKKPFYANALLVSGLLMYIINNVIGYISIVTPLNSLSLATSLKYYLRRVQRLSVYSFITSFLYSTSLLLFFTSAISFTKEKSFLLVAMIIVLIQLLFWSRRIWTRWIISLKQQVDELELDEVA